MRLKYALHKGSPAADTVRRRRSLVMLTPLVDVVFILLVFFMLASSFLDRRVVGLLTPPAATQASGSSSTGAILIRIRRDGSLNFSGEPMTPVRLAQEVAGRAVGDTQVSYLVQPDAGVSLQRVVSVVDLLNSSGARRVSLLRRPRP